MKKNKQDLEKQAEELLKRAEKRGLSSNYFFSTTFQRYRMQMKILEELEGAIALHGATVEKEYVRGSKNLMANPAITEYNKTATAANGTVATLIKILDALPDETKETDSLDEFLNDE